MALFRSRSWIARENASIDWAIEEARDRNKEAKRGGYGSKRGQGQRHMGVIRSGRHKRRAELSTAARVVQG